jgi:hypothetical protein
VRRLAPADQQTKSGTGLTSKDPESTSSAEFVCLADFRPSDTREFTVGQRLRLEINDTCSQECWGEGRLGDLLKACLIDVRLQRALQLESHSVDCRDKLVLMGTVVEPALLRVELAALSIYADAELWQGPCLFNNELLELGGAMDRGDFTDADCQLPGLWNDARWINCFSICKTAPLPMGCETRFASCSTVHLSSKMTLRFSKSSRIY